MPTKVPAAGDYIASKCTKCKDTTNHTIVAMVGEKVARVECNTCGSIHNYRGETVKKDTRQRKAQAAKPRTANKAERNWEELLKDSDPKNALPYSMNTPMKKDQIIQHPSFGLGRVINCIHPNKMEVCFQSGIKLLRCKID
jgi:Zn ribbon nucleic-acid-binding protein